MAVMTRSSTSRGEERPRAFCSASYDRLDRSLARDSRESCRSLRVWVSFRLGRSAVAWYVP